MSWRNWNAFTRNYPHAICFATALSAKLPKGAPRLDRNGLSLPTPYALLRQCLSGVVQGDWTSKRFGTGYIIKVADPADALAIQTAIGCGPQLTTPPGCTTCHRLLFNNANYGPVARSLGYAV